MHHIYEISFFNIVLQFTIVLEHLFSSCTRSECKVIRLNSYQQITVQGRGCNEPACPGLFTAQSIAAVIHHQHFEVRVFLLCADLMTFKSTEQHSYPRVFMAGV
jgi:hypothetical protein